LLGSLEFLSVKVSSSEYLLLAVVVEVAVRTVTLPYLTYCYLGGAHDLLVLFSLLLVALALT